MPFTMTFKPFTMTSKNRHAIASVGGRGRSLACLCLCIGLQTVAAQDPAKPSRVVGTQESSQLPNDQQKSSEVEESIIGEVTKVIDGDSFKVKSADGKEYEVQIEGTDAPELKQPYGKESGEALRKILGDAKVRVTWMKKDNFERPLAQVYLVDLHVNAEMIRTGNSWHFKRYNQSKELAELEIEAKKNKLGLWATDNPQAPWDYRKENRAPDKPDRPSSATVPASDK